MSARAIRGLACVVAMGAVAIGAACGDDETPLVVPSDSGVVGAPIADAQSVDAGPVRAPFGYDQRPANPTCALPGRPAAPVTVSFTEVFPNSVGAAQPMMLAQIPGDASRWFLAGRTGGILSFPTDGSVAPVQVASVPTLAGITVSLAGEGGLLGLAFDPNFAQTGRLFVSWTSTDGPVNGMKSRVGYLTSTNNGASFTTYTNILAFDGTFTIHKGGGLAFGPDGYLYLSFGDGGRTENGQEPAGFFSKLLRIDVAVPAVDKYRVPADNPFALDGGTDAGIEPATFARGFRNPFRFSIDRGTGEIWLGDVGSTRYEEVNLVKSGANHGWSCREGMHDFYGQHPTLCPLGLPNLTDPVLEHPRTTGVYAAVTGGVVYRGKAIPSLVGTYIYGDSYTEELFALEFDPVTALPGKRVLNPSGPKGIWVHFAEDADGEIFVVDLGGHIYKMVPSGPPVADPFPQRLSQTGCVVAARPAQPAAGLIPFAPKVPAFGDGTASQRYLALPDGAQVPIEPGGHLDVPPGTVLVENFDLGATRIETRLLAHHPDGTWGGYSYEWLDDGSDAVLLSGSKRKKIGDRTWYFPSRADCLRCHTTAARRSLGLEVAQLDHEIVYPTNRISNQLATLEHVGIISAPVPAVPALPALDGTATAEANARAYLHVNCASCHRPGEGELNLDLRFASTVAQTNACNVAGARGNVGVAGAMRLVPGDPSKSLLSIRLRSRGWTQMPPFGPMNGDVAGLGLVDAWISSLAACP